MAQVGINAGARHELSYGPAKSYVRLLDGDTMQAHDHDVIAAMTLTWSMCKTFMPVELMAAIESAVGDAGLPRIWTRNVPEGMSQSA